MVGLNELRNAIDGDGAEREKFFRWHYNQGTFGRLGTVGEHQARMDFETRLTTQALAQPLLGAYLPEFSKNYNPRGGRRTHSHFDASVQPNPLSRGAKVALVGGLTGLVGIIVGPHVVESKDVLEAFNTVLYSATAACGLGMLLKGPEIIRYIIRR